MIALLLLCGAVCCSVYFLATIIKSRPTGNRSPAPALGGITESRSAENKISDAARQMLNDLLKNFDSTSFGFPPVDLFNLDGLGYRPTYPRTDYQNGQNVRDPLAESSIDPKTMNGEDREQIFALLTAEKKKLVSEEDEVWHHCSRLDLLSSEAFRRWKRLKNGPRAERQAAGEVDTFLRERYEDAVAIRKRRELRLERIKLDIKALKK
jgi:hypothetical protein